MGAEITRKKGKRRIHKRQEEREYGGNKRERRNIKRKEKRKEFE
jgi:hypothetical protein